ncbi:hypothetical protein BFP72_13725 [Reichenbachiella sp. 5M10]|uniref:tRNA1(Val) (adenine(37)-N6)-methyltransferase n=1 Tax=Reichenbachiella sp. 5M10 TaxID=1889772 RepID=UPI000C149E63|nr:methyltransferase [Reichenbachiella sp. 5M10]PIB36378.1 hypothetical protein BFP72_13725 [Reichenbachiella sp. 5M10]
MAANTYFQFKQFTVHQERCAMKVSTEACLFGAWVPVAAVSRRVLDIGTGTGLLSLMLAQRSDVSIDAVEMDGEAAQQARQNFEASLWADRLHLVHCNVLEWENTDCYDLIISNPPFFTSSLKSQKSKNNLAKHDTGDFSKPRFAKKLLALLSNEGLAYVLYPEAEAEEFVQCLAKVGLYACTALVIRNQPDKAIFRMVLQVSREKTSIDTEELCIRNGQEHTPEFVKLLREYYLKY